MVRIDFTKPVQAVDIIYGEIGIEEAEDTYLIKPEIQVVPLYVEDSPSEPGDTPEPTKEKLLGRWVFCNQNILFHG